MRFLAIIPPFFLATSYAASIGGALKARANQFQEALDDKPLCTKFEVNYGDASVITNVPVGENSGLFLRQLTPPLSANGATRVNMDFPTAFFEITGKLVKAGDPRLAEDVEAEHVNLECTAVFSSGEFKLGGSFGPFCPSKTLSVNLPVDSVLISISCKDGPLLCPPPEESPEDSSGGQDDTAIQTQDGGDA